MIRNVCVAVGLLISSMLSAVVGQQTDRALLLDGKDNNVRTGMGLLSDAWTLELWVNSDVAHRGTREMLIAGGEYSSLSWVDNEALALVNGHLYATAARMEDPDTLDGAWHYVALTCDGSSVRMYRDGREIASKDTAYTILPGTIGVGETDGTFTGRLDEVRIWRKALAPSVLRRWANRSLAPSHPGYEFLYGYYPLDDFDGETSVNWVGRGHQAFHLRGGRNDWRGKAPLARAVETVNPDFRPYQGKQRLFNAVTIRSEWDCESGSRDRQMLKLRIAVQGSGKPKRLTGLTLNLDDNTSLSDIEAVHVYATGQKAYSDVRIPLFGGKKVPERRLVLKTGKDVALVLKPGINYVLVTFDIAETAKPGNRIGADVETFALDGTTYKPESTPVLVAQEVTSNNRLNPDVLKVLQWNIWHGGVHLADRGQQRVTELLKASDADVILMQEAYGIQHMAAGALDYNMKSKSDKDNLALYTRLPMEETIPWRQPFISNPAVVTMRNGHRVLLVDLWLRYANRPEYTCYYPERNGRPERWVQEDSILSLVDIRNIVEQDINPYRSEDMSVVLGGDFNAFSHLDWTERAAPLHYGYGPVLFPASCYLEEAGYADAFRTVHPDETKRPEGTWAAIYGQTPMGRIDFVYSHGRLRPVQSKVVRTMPEIDAVWPGDHAATVSVFVTADK